MMSGILKRIKDAIWLPQPGSETVVRMPGSRRPPMRRSYMLANIDRITNDFLAPITTGDVELRNSLPTMRARSRELERNNDYAKKYLHMLETNVIGKDGITLQCRARDPQGTLDLRANKIIENEWKEWGRRGICTVDGTLSFSRACKLILRTVARDGECIIRLIRGFKNPWKFAIQILEGDILDEQLNRIQAGNQNLIKMGIEYDEWNRPTAYHLREKHPGDYFISSKSSQTYKRVPASEIVHMFISERPTQGRGIPWMRTAARRMSIASAYEEAELVGARIGASKMGFYIPNPEGGADIVPDDESEDGTPIMEAEAGIFEKLPSGYSDFKAFMPEHPSGNYGPFMKDIKRGLCSGLNVAYNCLANDLEGVNMSSMRVGQIDERDGWKDLQSWFISDFLEILQPAWLEMLLLTDRTSLPYSKMWKFREAEWQPRSFDWVDPLKDIQADLMAIRAGLKAPQQVAAERGTSLDDLYEMIAEANKLAEKYKLSIDYSATVSKTGEKEAAEPEKAEKETEE